MLEIDQTVLVVIDVQGRLARLAHDHEKLIKQIQRLITVAQSFRLPIIWSEQAPDKIGQTVLPIQKMLSQMNIKPVAKKSLSCLGCDEFLEELKRINRPQVLLTGIETHVCVYQTARDLHAHGYDVYVLADAVSSREAFDHSIALERMQHEGITMTSTEMTICELLKTVDHPAFREILSHLKK